MRHADSTATLTNLLLLISAILILVSVASDVRSDWGIRRNEIATSQHPRGTLLIQRRAAVSNGSRFTAFRKP